MRNFHLVLALVLPLAAAAAAPKPKAALRFGGIYEEYPAIVDENDFERRWYLRFYADGTVIEKESATPPEKWKSKFERENENIARTTYTITGDRLAYAFERGDAGEGSDFKRAEGAILPGDKLKLTIKSGFKLRGATITIHNRPLEKTFAFIKAKDQKN